MHGNDWALYQTFLSMPLYTMVRFGMWEEILAEPEPRNDAVYLTGIWHYARGMAYVQMFRREDQVRLTQSPSGGGRGNPAWDFQFFIPDYEVGRMYRRVMRALYVPYESPEQIERATAPHRQALNPKDT